MKLRSVQTRRRGALLSMELLFIIPFFLGLTAGVVEYAMLLTIDQQLALASREAARVAAQGGTEAEVVAAAKFSLAPGRVRNHATVSITFIDSAVHPEVLPSGQAYEVRVIVPSAALVVPDLLRFVGVSIVRLPLAGRTAMRKE